MNKTTRIILTLVIALFAWQDNVFGQTGPRLIEGTAYYDTICSGITYTEHGFNYTPPSYGDFETSLTYPAANGEDSIVRLYLHVDRTYIKNRYNFICHGDEFHEYGFNLTDLPVGDHVFTNTMTSVAGCDSAIVLHLTVTPVYDYTIEDAICFGESYHQNGFDIENPSVGIHEATNTEITWYECDSIVHLKLRVGAPDDSIMHDTVCTNNGYHEHGFDVNELQPGLNTLVLNTTTTIGCDSTVTMYLFANIAYNLIFHDTICFGNDYDEHNFFFEMPEVGDHEDSVVSTTAAGCDSIAHLYLNVLPSYIYHITDSMGAGSVYNQHGFFINDTIPGWYNDTMNYMAGNGCDSIYILGLYIAETYYINIFDTICYGEDYHENDFDTINPPQGLNIIPNYYQTTLGFDSIVTLNLYVKQSYTFNILDTICFGHDYDTLGFFLEMPLPGDHKDSLLFLTTEECDSTYWLYLFVIQPADTIVVYDTIGAGSAYNMNGYILIHNNPGYYCDTLTFAAADGCDSVSIANLLVMPRYTFYYFDTICFGEDFHFYDTVHNHGFDTIQPEPGLCYMEHYYQTIHGYDSTFRMYLMVGELYNDTIFDTICQNVGYYEHGYYIENPPVGDFTDSYNGVSIFGCDSTVFLKLYVMPTYSDINIIDTICHGEIYNEHGYYLEDLPVGTYLDTAHHYTTFGCDSIISLNLYVYPTYVFHFTDTICEGNGYHEHGFDIDEIDLTLGMNQDTLFHETAFGCDSTFSLELYVAPVYNLNFNDTICFGESYHNYDFDTINPPVGAHFMQQNLTTTFGCDSIITMNLYVGEVYETHLTDAICQGENYTINGFNIINPEAGTIHNTLNLNSIVGCDSTVMLELLVSPTYVTEFRDTICHGEDYNGYGFNVITPDVGLNTYNLGETTAAGCDSAVRLYLYVSPTYSINLHDSICFGESYDNLGFVFTNPEIGNYEQQLNLSTDNGCDSVVMMHLFVGEVFSTTFRDTICFGESYYKHNFKIENPEVGNELYTQSLNTIYGCDSIINLRLVVTETYAIDVIDSICEGEGYSGFGLFIHEDEYEPGQYYFESRLKTIYGCDSIYNLNLKVINRFETPQLHGREFVVVSTDMITGEEKYYVDAIEGCNHYEWSIEYKWTSHNERWIFKPEHDTCRITVTTPGEAVLKVHASNSCSDVEQALDIRGTYFDVNEIDDINMTVYPNPCRYFVNIESKNIKEVNIINALGIMLRKEEFNMDNKVTIDLTGLPSALYILEVVTSEGRGLKRITVDNN